MRKRAKCKCGNFIPAPRFKLGYLICIPCAEDTTYRVKGVEMEDGKFIKMDGAKFKGPKTVRQMMQRGEMY